MLIREMFLLFFRTVLHVVFSFAVWSVLSLPHPCLALNFESDADIYSGFQEGYYDYATYLKLLDLYENKIELCSAPEDFLVIPDVTEEDILVLETLCSQGRTEKKDIPKPLRVKIASFVYFKQDTLLRALNIEYHFVRNFLDSAPYFEKDHLFKIKFNSRHILTRTQGRSDGFGHGYFSSNSLKLRNIRYIRACHVGSFNPRRGSGLTLGGAASPTSYKGMPETFAQTLYAPRNAYPFGLFLSLALGRISPFGVLCASHDRTDYKGKNLMQAGGLEFMTNRASGGIVMVHTRTNTLNHQARLLSSNFGIYGSVKPRNTLLKSELSVADSGLAFDIKGVKSGEVLDIGMGLRHYSLHYLNPAGRGRSQFYSNATKIFCQDDSLSLRGIRQGEQNMDAFLRFHKRNFYVRPAVLMARSAKWDSEKYVFSIIENWAFSRIRSALRLEQAFSRRKEYSDTLNALALSAIYLIPLQTKCKLELRTRYTALDNQDYKLALRLNLAFPLFSGIALKTGYLFSKGHKQGILEETSSLFLEERIKIGKAGRLSVYGLICLNHYTRLLEPLFMGLCLNLFVI
jgi:hypothetical protein